MEPNGRGSIIPDTFPVGEPSLTTGRKIPDDGLDDAVFRSRKFLHSQGEGGYDQTTGKSYMANHTNGLGGKA